MVCILLDYTGLVSGAKMSQCWRLQVFCYTGDKAHEEMRQACFDYLRLGGMYSSGPISLLSGMNPRPSVLVMHFFMVAIFGVGRCVSGQSALVSCHE